MLDFIHAIEQLKKEMRHSYLSDGRQESVAEHSWRMAVMALALKPEEKIDAEKCVKMAVIHYLPEVFAGDVFALEPKNRIGKYEKEKRAMENLCKMINDKKAAKEIFELWLEFEEAKTPEARFVKMLDKFDVLIQHNESDIKTWAEVEKQTHYGMASKHSERWGMLTELAKRIDEETHDKLLKNGIKPDKLTQEEYERIFGKV